MIGAQNWYEVPILEAYTLQNAQCLLDTLGTLLHTCPQCVGKEKNCCPISCCVRVYTF